MKKIIAFIMLITMLTILCGCSNEPVAPLAITAPVEHIEVEHIETETILMEEYI